LPSSDKGIFTKPLPSNDRVIVIELLPSNDEGIFTEPLPSYGKWIFTEPLPSNDRGDAHAHRQERDLISLLYFSKQGKWLIAPKTAPALIKVPRHEDVWLVEV
jgi:hypothetical protein